MPNPTPQRSDNDPLWYKDAVIYETHVRAFYDSNADGMGDFKGLGEKLDYLEDLGVTAIWLLPFFPSPWKDDGYDISDFRSVHPAYGTLRDFQAFLREAHRRNLRVITELVVNHTSDQHEWFQKSRRAEPGSSWRDFYVWSDSPTKYTGTRIIFKDFEPSNWTWDPVAKAYFWHRFYSHQPDLNFDSPLVRRTIIRTLDFWAQIGVDGFRLDAIPYLFEREGTSCENLPETHAFLKELRKHMDTSFPGRMFLAEANMWPEDAVAYFGTGNECHMSFHFPLMPRLFMALRLEDRLPIVEILKRTPAIPENCQWAMFLRNHDELTLEMVTDEERDYMYRSYAADQRSRINLGIRRRLAPLLGNDRSRIEVMNALLFSMPGTPVLYYGDEIGMGDNVYLGDRNGVRTPMQWSPDRNAGFSATNPQRLFLPVNIDPAYHYEAINVESQQENSNSLLNWTKRLIALRKRYKAFGRGTLEFLTPSNQRVLAFIRRYADEIILVVANLSRFAQAVELDLGKFRGYTPVEMFGRTDFPAVGEDFYPITLGPSSFFWFGLEQRAVPTTVRPAETQLTETDVPILTAQSAAELWQAHHRAHLAAVLPRFFAASKWFTGVNRRIRSVRVQECMPLQSHSALALVAVDYASGEGDFYFVPLALLRGDEARILLVNSPNSALARVQSNRDGELVLADGTLYGPANLALLDAVARRKRFRGDQGAIVASHNRQFRKFWGGKHPNLDPVTLSDSTVHTTVQFGQQFVMNVLRGVQPGPHPGAEMGQFLTGDPQTALPFVAPFAGEIQYQPDMGEPVTVSLLHGYVPNSGTAWDLTLTALAEYMERVRQRAHIERELLPMFPTSAFSLAYAMRDPSPLTLELIEPFLEQVRQMGTTLAQMHSRLSSPDIEDPAFQPEPFNDFYRQGLYHGYLGLAGRRLEYVRQHLSDMDEVGRALANRVLELEDAILDRFKAIFIERIASVRTRFHGRLHLGHVLVNENRMSFYDFEGDPLVHLSERRIKRCPLRDVATMLASFGYATQVGIRNLPLEESDRPTDERRARVLARFWFMQVAAAFLRAYWTSAASANYIPASQKDSETLLTTYILERAMLDIRSDIQSRPGFAHLPFRLILHILNAEFDLPYDVDGSEPRINPNA